ncbi:YfiR family protein [bacterium]|nr:YfiR family protein [bacterium]
MKRFCYFFLIIIIFLNFMAFANINKEVGHEEKIKSVFIYNFTKYIQWSNNDTSNTFKIAFIGDSKIIIPLKEIAEKRTIGNKKIRIKHYHDIQDIDMCHILFISASEKGCLKNILQKVGHENILTISDSKGFADKGVAINLVVVADKIKFEINSSALKRAGLHVSSQLLKLAILVEEAGG